jgi:hypothetical protein
MAGHGRSHGHFLGRKPGGPSLHDACSKLGAFFEQESSFEQKTLINPLGRRPSARFFRVALVNFGRWGVEVCHDLGKPAATQGCIGQLWAVGSGGWLSVDGT